jgi:hypothetical protein
MGCVLNMFGMGRPMAAAALWGACFIGLAWAALWLRPPYGACASYVWHGERAQYVWHGPPYGCGRRMGRALNICGLGRPMAAVALWGACSTRLAWAAPMGRVLNMFDMGRPMAAAALLGVF